MLRIGLARAALDLVHTLGDACAAALHPDCDKSLRLLVALPRQKRVSDACPCDQPEQIPDVCWAASDQCSVVFVCNPLAFSVDLHVEENWADTPSREKDVMHPKFKR